MNKYMTHNELSTTNELMNSFSVIDSDISRKFQSGILLNLLKDEIDNLVNDIEEIDMECLQYITKLNELLNDFNDFKDLVCESIINKGVLVNKDDDMNIIISKLPKINEDDFQKHIMNTSYNIFSSLNLEYPIVFDTHRVKNMYRMFYNCSELKRIPLYNTENVTNMKYSFYRCKLLEYIPKLNMSKVINIENAFSGTGLKLFVNNTTTKIEKADSMFDSCINLKYVRLDTTNLINAWSMFSSCESLESVEFINGTHRAKNMQAMFMSCNKIKSIKGLNTENVQDMMYMFSSCKLIQEVYLDTTSVQNMKYIFNYCYNLTKIRFNPDASNITDFSISDCTKMTSKDLVAMFESLPTPKASRTITLGDVLLNRLTEEQKQIAINKNYVLA